LLHAVIFVRQYEKNTVQRTTEWGTFLELKFVSNDNVEILRYESLVEFNDIYVCIRLSTGSIYLQTYHTRYVNVKVVVGGRREPHSIRREYVVIRTCTLCPQTKPTCMGIYVHIRVVRVILMRTQQRVY